MDEHCNLLIWPYFFSRFESIFFHVLSVVLTSVSSAFSVTFSMRIRHGLESNIHDTMKENQNHG